MSISSERETVIPAEEPKIRIGSYGAGRFTLGNLRPDEINMLEGVVHDHLWCTVTDGRLEIAWRREKLPEPTEDETMMPFWRRATPGVVQLNLIDLDIPTDSSPSIVIQHLCGYFYSKEGYA